MVDASSTLVKGIRELLESLGDERDCVSEVGITPHPTQRAAARNLAAYVAMRSRDLRPLQEALREEGLASFEHDEGAVREGLERILAQLGHGQGKEKQFLSGTDARRAREKSTARLFGDSPVGLVGPRWMVTWPGGKQDPKSWCRLLSAEGMSIVRINGAHGSCEEWTLVAQSARQVAQETGRPLKVAFDLAGPKLRVATFDSSPRVVKVRPRKDARGRVCEWGLVRLKLAGTREVVVPSLGDGDALPRTSSPGALAPEVFLHVDVASSTVKLDAGDVVCLRDSLGRRRRLTLLDEHGLAAARKTTRLLSQTSLKLKRSGSTIAVGRVADLGTVPKEATLAKGEVFLLRLCPGPSLPEKRDKLGNVLTRARIGCTWPEALAQLAVGHRVLLDDGRVAARVLEIHEDSAHLEVENVGRTDASGRAALKGERGLNLPDTPLPHVGLTPADSLALSRMAPFVDIVQLSFVQEAADILQVDEALVEFPKIGVIAKIETDAAVRNLPSILSALHVRESAGVLIARGDLALECGFERLTELQEEILWLAEAAHLPVVWATQVLESLVKNGVRSRAEMTDASRAVLAEAVMLNKGPYVAEALGVLRDLAVRVSGHQEKRRHLLRPLSIATWASRSH